MFNFLSNIGAYLQNLLTYERDIRSRKYATGFKFLPGENLHSGANCAQ